MAAEYLLKTTRQRLYPSLPQPPLERPVGFDAYVGQYHNPGYGTFNVSLQCGEQKRAPDSPAAPSTDEYGCRLAVHALRDAKTASVMVRLELEHVSGDYWIGWAFMDVYKNYHRPLAGVRLQFRVGPSGLVRRMGVDVRLEGEDVPLTWFDRQAT
jgi:Domain of unknown function (DUF3471)